MKVQTVCGVIEPEQLGYTLTHEHFHLDFDHHYTAPPQGLESFLSHKLALDNIGFVKQYPYSSHHNLNFHDEDTFNAVIKDLVMYRRFGGGSVVENTSHGLGRDLKVLYDISKETNVHVIAGTGHYTSAFQSHETLAMDIDKLTDLYMKEILFGVEVNGLDTADSTIKCGFVGEVGSSWPISHFEKEAIVATAEVQQSLKCGVTFHPGRDPQAPFEIIRMYLEAGGDPKKCVMSHLDRTIFKDEELYEFAKLNTYCQFDLFGIECSFYQLNDAAYMPSDEQRLEKVMKLLNEGHENQVLLSHDIHTKHRLIPFGGHGYSHILNNILMRLSMKGVSLETIDQITVKNPANWLQIDV